MMISFLEFLTSKPNQLSQKTPTYNFLVVAALQEELSAFIGLSENLRRERKLNSDAVEFSYKKNKKDKDVDSIKILTYTPNKMGLSYNGAAIMRIIMLHQPIYTFFIGTCAGLKSGEQKPGDVIVPHMIYNYESGKHKSDGTFEPDHTGFETDEEIRKYSEQIKHKVSKDFNVITDENFCSGSSVVDFEDKKREIIKNLPRKVSGLDMEAYSIACINNILKTEGKKVTVIKGIMDFAEKKELSEKAQNKTKAKINSAKFTLELIQYIHNNILNNTGIKIN